MKLFLVVTALLISVALLGAAANSTVTYVDHEKVAKGGTLVTAPDLSVSVNRRTAAGQVEVHDKETDTFYVIDGEATVITGGTMVGGAVSRPNQWLGKSIEGGETHHLVKGGRDGDSSRYTPLVQGGSKRNQLLRREGHQTVNLNPARIGKA